MSKPGVVLRRPVGTDQPFREHSDLPKQLPDLGPTHGPRKTKAPKPQLTRTTTDEAARKALTAFEKEQRQREIRRRKEAARERERQRRGLAIAKAQAALEKGERDHQSKVATIEVARNKKLQVEDARWGKEKKRLEGALRRARE
jgi:hypothetical protein